MRSHRSTVFLILVMGLVSPCLGDDAPAAARPTVVEPLTRGRAAQVLADSDAIAADLEWELKNLQSPHEAAVVDDIRDAMSHSSEWQWYARDRGILLAIPVRERLGVLAGYDGEKVLAAVVRRLISQKGWGSPLVQVVLLEPKDPSEASGCVVGQSMRLPTGTAGSATATCSCR